MDDLQFWTVVGGGSKGGILVRQSRDLSSPAFATRLVTGAVVRQEELDGDCLRFSKVDGQGPDKGWVTIALKGKDLLIRKSLASPPTDSEVAPTVSAEACTEKIRKLSNGVCMPILGLGTGGDPGLKGEECRRIVRKALELGYRCIDTADMYQNHKEIGIAVRESGVPRKEVFVISKLAPFFLGEQQARAAVKRMLGDLGMEQLDLVLIHWPGAWAPEQQQWSLRDWMQRGATWSRQRRLGTWRALEQLYQEGLVRSIGVSNFTLKHLGELEAEGLALPHVLQAEFHPYYSNAEVCRWCAERGVVVSSYAPLGGYLTEQNTGQRALDDPTVQRVASELGCTPAQVALLWAIARGSCPVPKTCNVARLAENLEALRLDGRLSMEQLVAIDALDRGKPLYWDSECVDILDNFNPFLDRKKVLQQLEAFQSRQIARTQKSCPPFGNARGSFER